MIGAEGRPPEFNGNMSSSVGGGQPQPRLGRNQCAICKKEGHWKRECEPTPQHLLTSLFGRLVNGGLSGYSRKDVLGKAVDWRIVLVLLGQGYLQVLCEGCYCW